MTLVGVLILRPLARDRLRSALTVLSVALGVAVIIAIQLAGEAATGSFRASMEALAGRTDLEIRANGGVDEQWMGRLASLPLEVRFSPFMEAQANLPGVGEIALYGADAPGLAANAGGPPRAVLSRALAERLGLPESGARKVLSLRRPSRDGPKRFR